MFDLRREALWSIALVFLMAIVLGLPTAAADGQTWNFTDANHNDFSPGCGEDDGFCLMEKPEVAQAGSVDLEEGNTLTWVVTDAVDAGSIDFGGQDWSLTLDCEESVAVSGQGTVTLGALTSGSVFSGAGSAAYDCSEDEILITPDGDFVISEDEYLALEFELEDFILVTTYEQTFEPQNMTLTSPNNDPGYPVWEISSVGLLGVGLLCVGLVVKRR